MFEVRSTEVFDNWLDSLKDIKASEAIAKRLVRFSVGLLGDVEPVGDGVSEARIHYGPGYRIYFVKRGRTIIVLICGGTKRTQPSDIKKAKVLAASLE
ncbi:addiction module toxin [Gluconacetobacter johannae DSM 13595]|uniref:Type II toxin-antitoxin system RelE/ParE family toxin n=1 Tax=Gluconacetobacter johannae TaxID=112140 RepID=A0A7W4J839_9PROT|nr:type II toxin-antitoxin system RelE/ParE family toxin [Gluconacetobacter johannae]MBB2176177.1 type II toxin-antitoxin system RelE/ParE family toxin [Gluconacetobacter johannae]GBQ89287.1 addiction module toxin [Gluconacetobacter johannae DSM 13595]